VPKQRSHLQITPISGLNSSIGGTSLSLHWHRIAWRSDTQHNEANRIADWFGRAKVRFHTDGVDVTLYQVRCIKSPLGRRVDLFDCPYKG
jgi:hypothetical protein